MDIAGALKWLEAHPEIESVRAAVCDLNGIMRGKRLPRDQAEKALAGGLRMPLSVPGLDIWGKDIAGNPMVFETGDADGRCDWTGRAVMPMNWLARPTAMLPVWLADEHGVPFLGDPRRALATVLAGYAELGLTPVTATELEFYLVDPNADLPLGPLSPATGRRLDSAAAMDMDEVDQFEAFIDDVYVACHEQGIPADTTIAENGIGQFEINLNHTSDALQAADDALFFKRTVKGIARKHGLAACFMAKPYGHHSGSGFHIHFSLLDREGNNVFDNGGDEGTEMMRHAIGGMLAAMAESTLIFAPHYNSYRRLRPNSYAPTAVAWGYENRMVAIRIPGGSHKARRIEHRVAGADANPYLVMAAVLGAALIGIRKQLSPGEPRSGDAYGKDLEKLPLDWHSAINAFEVGQHAAEIFSPVLRSGLVACKRQELEAFATQITQFEYRTYLETA
ncbi:glutamine synthetase family protein [Neorhizobium sp. T25_27]|uniref:glutamine synthetase family protein n=1 Tax=Neorhizobium sp. T25_27 TaxID=2093831 RepID=UPI001FE1F5AE|nr:glutamine synthetase family protein [Neorhizobium sp. T25_27]